jgi:GNAT superfamily N-acetyltransferase
MTETHARSIAMLLNSRNKLARKYTAEEVLREANNYEYEIRDGEVVAFVERKKVQWYQWEILHLYVHPDWEGKGVAFAVYQRAEATARTGSCCVLQCTIREGNEDSEKFFRRQGYLRVGSFLYPVTGNKVGVWQKVLSVPANRTEIDQND